MLKIFGQFKNIILEMYGNDSNIKITRKYAIITSRRCQDSPAYFDRTNRSWKDQVRVYFDAEPWVIASLRLLGIHIVESKAAQSLALQRYGKACQYYMSNVYWFWKLVEYGYRLGIQVGIPFDLYQERNRIAKESA